MKSRTSVSVCSECLVEFCETEERGDGGCGGLIGWKQRVNRMAATAKRADVAAFAALASGAVDSGGG